MRNGLFLMFFILEIDIGIMFLNLLNEELVSCMPEIITHLNMVEITCIIRNNRGIFINYSCGADFSTIILSRCFRNRSLIPVGRTLSVTLCRIIFITAVKVQFQQLVLEEYKRHLF